MTKIIRAFLIALVILFTFSAPVFAQNNIRPHHILSAQYHCLELWVYECITDNGTGNQVTITGGMNQTPYLENADPICNNETLVTSSCPFREGYGWNVKFLGDQIVNLCISPLTNNHCLWNTADTQGAGMGVFTYGYQPGNINDTFVIAPGPSGTSYFYIVSVSGTNTLDGTGQYAGTTSACWYDGCALWDWSQPSTGGENMWTLVG